MTRPVGIPAAVQAAVIAVIGTLVGLGFSRVFGAAGPLVLAVAVAAAVPAALAWGLAAAGRSAFTSGLCSGLAFLVVSALVVFDGAPTADTIGTTLRALRDGPSRILSSPLPVSDDPELVIVVAATVWWAVALAAELAVRRRSVVVPIVPLALASAVPLALGVGGPAPGRLSLGALLGAAGVLVLLRSIDSRAGVSASPRSVRAGRRARLVAGVPVVVAAAVVIPLLGTDLPLVADRRPVDPRTVPVGDERETISPLSLVNGQIAATSTEELFTVVAPDGVRYWQQVVLDVYDGAAWTSSASWEPAGEQLPDRGDVAPNARSIEARVEVSSLLTDWLPVAGRPTEIEGVDVRFDPVTGTLLTEEPLEGSVDYTVRSTLSDPTEEQLAGATRSRRGPGTERAIEPVPAATAISQLAREVVANDDAASTGSADLDALRALQRFFADTNRFSYSTEPVAGHSLRQLTSFVTGGDPEQPGATEGSAEQFAAAYAVMARTLGFATRVAVGYRAGGRDESGRYHVTNRDAFAWPEVRLAGLGWVPFASTPLQPDQPRPQPRQPPPEPQDNTTTTTLSSTSTGPTSEPEVTEVGAGGGGGPLWPVVAAGLVTAGLLALVLATTGGRRIRRRRRRLAPSAADRILGAWREATDRLVTSGVPLGPSMTVAEVVATSTAAVGPEPVRGLGRLGGIVNQARYSPGVAPDPVATEAWELADGVSAGLAHRRSPAQRLRDLVDPRTVRPRWRTVRRS